MVACYLNTDAPLAGSSADTSSMQLTTDGIAVTMSRVLGKAATMTAPTRVESHRSKPRSRGRQITAIFATLHSSATSKTLMLGTDNEHSPGCSGRSPSRHSGCCSGCTVERALVQQMDEAFASQKLELAANRDALRLCLSTILLTSRPLISWQYP